MKPSTYYFHMKMKILADFQICISVPLIVNLYRRRFGVVIVNFEHISLTYLAYFVIVYVL